MTRRPTLVLWLDLETTGLDPDRDKIIEIGAAITTTDLDNLMTYSALIDPTPPGWDRLAADPKVRSLHRDSGLLAEIEDPNAKLVSAERAEGSLVRLLDAARLRTGAGDWTFLAGTNVDKFDRPFLERAMPDLAGKLHRGFDVGSLTLADSWWDPTPTKTASARPHRGLDDILATLETARRIRATRYAR